MPKKLLAPLEPSYNEANEADPDEITPRLRPANDMPSQRHCMRCGQQFASEGWHNRLCRPCRSRGTQGL